MRFQAGTQIILVLLSLVIIIMVIKPMFAEIQSKQDDIAAYSEALAKVNEYNSLLQDKINRVNNISRADRTALEKFLPDTIDQALVARDISNIVEKNQLLLQNIKVNDEVPVTETQRATGELASNDFQKPADLTARVFSVQVLGSYAQMKQMLQDLERNAYPLRLTNLTFDANNGSSLHQFSFELETYALTKVSTPTI